MCLSKERFEPKMIPRFLADSAGVIDELSGRIRFGIGSLESWVGRPMRRNSVFDGLRVRKLEAIHCDIAANVTWRLPRAALDACGEKEMNNWVSSA
jgi:hypothetical protein